MMLLLLLFDWLVFFPSSVLSVKMKYEHNRTEYKKILYHIYVREWERRGGLLVVKVEYDVQWVWEKENKAKEGNAGGRNCEKENFFIYIYRRRQKILLRWVVLFLCWMGFKHCGKIHNLIEWAHNKKKEHWSKIRKNKNHRMNKENLCGNEKWDDVNRKINYEQT